jgi:threonine dehydratase
MTERNDYLERILTSRCYDVAIETPLEPAEKLSKKLNNQIYFKREDLQPVFSFKLRGAYNKVAHLSEKQRNRGIIASSAGNHAQGVALAAQRFDCRAVIVMPITTPAIKIDAVRSFGAEVVTFGDSYQETEAHALSLAESENLTFIHPYDDPDVIAGQGTIGVEILRQFSGELHSVFVPVGGGGLISGIGAYLKRLRPDIKLIGVEPQDAPSMYESLKAGKLVTLPRVGAFVDGAAVKKVGQETFRLCRKYVDEIILVDTDSVCAAIKDVFEDTRSILEPAGALSIAGMKQYIAREQIENKSCIAVASGANMNFNRLRHVAERAELGEEREALMVVTIPEQPGSLKRFCSVIGSFNITEFDYRYDDCDDAHILVGIEVMTRSRKLELLETLSGSGFAVIDLTYNEAAKLHVRHMVGGRNHLINNERIFSFQFPERPGALVNFLEALGPNWNISLFNYRYHGADIGRVLIGLQVPENEADLIDKYLSELGFAYWEETDNPACRLFL